MRSRRRLVKHRRGEVRGGRVYGAAGAASDRGLPAVRFAVPLPPPSWGPQQRGALRRRVWAWRLLVGAWFVLTVAAACAGVHWFGVAGLGCPLMMAGPLLLLWWAAVSETRWYAAVLHDGGD